MFDVHILNKALGGIFVDKFPWWNETQNKLADEVDAFGDQYCPDAEEAAWRKQTPWKVLKEVKRKGWFGALVPKKYGGLREELGITGACIINEGLSRLGIVGTVFGGSMFGGVHQIEHFGTDEQKKRWLPGMAKGDKIGAICITEPPVGSDAAAVATEAKLEGDEYIITGKKRFTTCLGIADIYMFYARTSEDPKDRQANKHLTAFIIEKGMKGFTVEKVNELCGADGLLNGYLDLDETPVPVSNRLAGQGDGWGIMVSGLNVERTIASAQLLGMMREAIRFSHFHTQRRVQFDQPTMLAQINQFRIADMIMRLKTSRLLIYHAAHLLDIGGGGLFGPVIEATIAKLLTSEFYVATTANAVQVMGGDGLTKFYPIEAAYRASKIMEIAAGTSEVMRMILYRMGTRIIESEILPPRRVIHPELGVPLDHFDAVPESEKLKIDEENVLNVLAEDYRVNPGLYMSREDLLKYLKGTEEELDEVLMELEEKKLTTLSRDRRGTIKLAKATYAGLKKSHPLEYYQYYPPWVNMDELF
jgi:alkylation response protein AidB-like acyl-CoA dehydrogenase